VVRAGGQLSFPKITDRPLPRPHDRSHRGNQCVVRTAATVRQILPRSPFRLFFSSSLALSVAIFNAVCSG
jgi:hypothetical protein